MLKEYSTKFLSIVLYNKSDRWVLSLFRVFPVVLMLFFFSYSAQAQCWLEARGTQIVNSSTGQEVILRGVNLGDWGLQEGYMLNPQNPNIAGTQWSMKKLYYNQGQTEAQVEAFYASWRNNFITKADIDYIASLGFNTIRLPMHYELFLTASQRSVRNSVIRDINNHDNYKASLQSWYNNNQLFNDTNADGFKMIDNLLSWCMLRPVGKVLTRISRIFSGKIIYGSLRCFRMLLRDFGNA